MYYWKVYILKWFYRQNLEVAFIDQNKLDELSLTIIGNEFNI